jgi:predicted HAD superfamily Cof-like phosphohydrolase
MTEDQEGIFFSHAQAHNIVSENTREPPTPFSPSAVTLANIISYETDNEVLESSGVSAEKKELLELLTSPHISALITTHDKVANKEYPLQSVDADNTNQPEMNGPIRIVYVDKKRDPLVRLRDL